MDRPRKAFLSYRSVDSDRVKVIATALRSVYAIDAWFDGWEVSPGDNVVWKINEGLEQCDCSVVFLSNDSVTGIWQLDEVSILKIFAVTEQRPLIPVLLDEDVKIPAILLPYARLLANDTKKLAEAIIRRESKRPPLGGGLAAPARARFSIHLRETADSTIGVSAQLDATPLVAEQPVHPGPGFVFSYSDFLRGRLGQARLSAAGQAQASRESDLIKLGEAVGNLVFAGDIDRELSSRLNGIVKGDCQEIELCYEVTGNRLLGVPFEAARLSDGRTPALVEGVFTWREPALKPIISQLPGPGPLRILVAVGAVDEDKTQNSVLNSERELETIFAALEQAQKLGNAYLRVLEVGSPQQIGAALQELSFHVLHLSGHGRQGELELEDEDGNPVPTTAAQLGDAILTSGHPPPLIVLASCHGGTGDEETGSFAQGLLDRGVPAVLAMQTAVSDYYATELAGRFYSHLANDEQPFASRALALARQELEKRRRNAPADLPPEGRIPEYATPSLFLRGEEQPVLNRALAQVKVPEKPVTPSAGAVPMLGIGELIGRRKELRRILGVLTDDATSVAKFGRQAGSQILGTGGVGKSTLAGRAMQRMADRGWTVATISGNWDLGRIASELAGELWSHPVQELRELARNFADEDAPDKLRLQWVSRLLSNHPVLLVLDNFEDNLTPGGEAFLDIGTERNFMMLLHSVQRAKLLVTCRYPLPNCDSYLDRVDLGPFSSAETRKKMLRLEGLKSQTGENLKLLERAIGGHPRTLEYLDALLRHGHAKFAEVTEKLRGFANARGIQLQGDAPFGDRVRDAIAVAAADCMVEELLRLLAKNPGDLALLWQASVFPFAVPWAALVFDPDAPDALVDLTVSAATLSAAIERLTASSLLTPRERQEVYVHRWTAEALKQHAPEGTIELCCLRAARYLVHRASNDRSSQGLTDSVESVNLFLQAGAFDDAARLAWQLIDFLNPRGQTTLWTEISHVVASSLPEMHDEKSRFMRQESDGLRALGAGDEAFACAKEALRLDEQKVAKEPGRADYLRDLSVSYERMGDLQAGLGDGESVRQFFEKALKLRERLVAQEPERADYLRDLSISYNKMGDLHRALGDGDSARQFYEKALEIAKQLVAQEPGRADYQRDLSVSYDRMADLHRALGDGDSARQFYEKALEAREQLVAQEPGRADYQRDLSVSYNRMGDLHNALGDGESARQFYEKALEAREQLVAQEPGRADYQRDLSVSYDRMADLHRALGDGDSARQFYEKALEAREQLVAQEPGRADYQRDLSVSYNRMGDLHNALGDGDSARQFYEKALEIAEQLVEQEPGRADYLRDLSFYYTTMGDLNRAKGNEASALDFFRKGLRIDERLVELNPEQVESQIDLSVSLVKIGGVANLVSARAILLHLKAINRLPPAHEPKIAALHQMIEETKQSPSGGPPA